MPRNSKDGSYQRYNSVQKISKKYLIATHQPVYSTFASGSVAIANERKEFIKVVDKTLESLEYFDRDFILKEFFSPDESKFWWMERYPRSTYYRFRSAAVKAFLNEFYDKYKESYGFDYYSFVC